MSCKFGTEVDFKMSEILVCKCGKEYKTDRGYNNHIEKCEAMKQKALPILSKKAPAKRKKQTKLDGFHLKLDNSRIFKGVVAALVNIIDETHIVLTPNKMEISAMDPSRICFLKYEIERSIFDLFNCDEEYLVPINLFDFEKILRRASDKDSIELIFDVEQQKIKVRLQREGGRVRTFSLRLIDIEYEEIPFENFEGVEQYAFFNVEATEFEDLLKDAELYSEVLEINAKENEDEENCVIFTSSGQIGELEAELGEEELLNLKIDKKSFASYSTTFLKAFMKLSSVTENLKMEYATNSFLKMFFDIIEGSKVTVYLAPRVDQEGELDDAMIEEMEYENGEAIEDASPPEEDLEEDSEDLLEEF